MGCSYSEPIEYDPSDGLIAISLLYDKVRLLHATQSIMERIQNIVNELYPGDSPYYEYMNGSMQIKFPGWPFWFRGGKESLFLGKMFVLKLLKEMYVLRYDLITSTNVNRNVDQGTLIFERSSKKEIRSKPRLLCIAPMDTDKLVLIGHEDAIIQAVRHTISATWSPGIQQESLVHPQFEFKLSGNPWRDVGRSAVMCRRLLLEITICLAAYNWKFHAAVNVQGGTDALFFIFDENYLKDRSALAFLSLHRYDRIRDFNFGQQDEEAIRSAILKFHQTEMPDERYYHGVHEFELSGRPFAASGIEAIGARNLMSRIFEELHTCGWQVISAIDVSRRISDKSIFLFECCKSEKLKFACVATADSDNLYIHNFPLQISHSLCKVVHEHYRPGVKDDVIYGDGSSHQLKLQGYPWHLFGNSSYNLHAISMLMKLIKEASSFGWKVVLSADVSARYVSSDDSESYPVDADTIFFCYRNPPKDISTLDSVASIKSDS